MSRLDGWIEAWAATDRIAITFEGHDLTYRQLHQRIGATAAGLEALGVAPGDRVAFCGLNRVELFEALFACARIGAIFLPLNNRLTATEIGVQLEDSEPTVVLVTDGFATLVADTGSPVSCRDLDTEPFPDSASGPDPDPAVGADSPVLMVYTSGTTGRPKGAVLTQGALLHTARNGIDQQGLSGADVIVAPLPTFHVGGLNIQTLPTLKVGGRVLLLRRFDPAEVLQLISTLRPTQTLLVPAMLQAVAAHPDFAATDLSCLDGIVTGSSVVPMEVMAPFFERGVPVAQVYGASETGPTSVVGRYDDPPELATSCGRPATHTELRIVGGDGRPVEAGVAGELWLRGPNLFSGYWNNPDATSAAFVGEWYRTGDIGYQDDQGYVHISDRMRDVYISGGENVYPAEVEATLIAHPAIAEVAVVARPDPRWGEVGVAIVVLEAGASLDQSALGSWCSDKLARYKHPHELLVVAELPRTALGKVQKHVLRARHGYR